MSVEQNNLIELEIQQMLQNGAISLVKDVKGQYLNYRNLFLVPKKDGGQRPVINLKGLNQFLPYEHFKMEGLHCLRDILQHGDYMCKLDLKDAYFSVSLDQESRSWQGNLFEFNCLCFGLGPAPRVFTKLLKIPMAVLRRLNIKVIIYLDDLLILGCSREETIQARDTEIFLLQHLGFFINLKKSAMTPTQEIVFLGLKVNSVTMILSLTAEKLRKVKAHCSETTVLDLTKLIGLLSSTSQAVMPARLEFRFLQQMQIRSLKSTRNYMTKLNFRGMQEGTSLVDRKPKFIKRQVDYSTSGSSAVTDRCIEGWGQHAGMSEQGDPGHRRKKISISTFWNF